MKEGWEYKKLGDITEIKGGKRLPKGVKLLTTPTEHPYIRVADFNDFGTVDTDDIHYISDSVYEQIKRYIIKKEDVYISIAGTIGKSGIIPDYLDGANLTENACRLILSSNVCQRYVYYFTISPSFIKQIDERTKKSAQPKLALTRLSDVIITYPTIKEQKSIVDYLDSAFAKIDAMKANAEKALGEAKALFQASLKEMLEPKEGWEEKKLGEMSEIQSGFAFKSTQFLNSGKYQVIRMGNVRPGLIRYNESPVYVEAMEENKIDKALLKVGDMIITQTGSRNKRDYGYSVLIDKENLLLNQRIARIRVISTITNKYLLYYSWTDYFRDQYFANEGGTVGQGNVGIDAIKYATITFPPLSEQQSIVATLDSLKSKVDHLQSNFEKISQECDALKQAILRQVFE